MDDLTLSPKRASRSFDEIEHLLGDVGVDVLAGAGFERELADASRAAADSSTRARRIPGRPRSRNRGASSRPGEPPAGADAPRRRGRQTRTPSRESDL